MKYEPGKGLCGVPGRAIFEKGTKQALKKCCREKGILQIELKIRKTS